MPSKKKKTVIHHLIVSACF